MVIGLPGLLSIGKAAGLDGLKVHIDKLDLILKLSAYYIGKGDSVEQRRNIVAGRYRNLLAA